MKKLNCSLTVLVTVLLAGTLQAQTPQTIFGGEARFGGFGGPAFTITAIDGNPAVLSGGRGGASVRFTSGQALHFGGGGYGMLTSISTETPEGAAELSLGYGGLELEYVHNRLRATHLSWGIHFGGGSATEMIGTGAGSTRNESGFFVIEPAMAFNINLTPTARARVGGGYRLATGTNLATYSDQALSGPSIMISFLFGYWP